jgi:guanidinoacetate N-methyltransferase
MTKTIQEINEKILSKIPQEHIPKFAKQREDWISSAANYSADGKLSILGLPVMEEWERPYMEQLAKVATSNGGTVLELGYGMGISANYIQEHVINKHIVVEANAEVFNKLKEFSQTSEREVEPLLGFWQDVVVTIPDGSIDGILFDVFAITKGELGVAALSFFKDAYRLLKKGGVLTFYMNRDEFLPHHFDFLHSAGFEDIRQEKCSVNPPEECEYCNASELAVPIIHK